MEPLSFWNRLVLSLRLWNLKGLVKVLFFVIRLVKPLPASNLPTLKRYYKVRPHLENRIFMPRTYTKTKNYPLYIDIHGGGFCIQDPQVDDLFCSTMANKCNMIVVSINYGKGPGHRYPGPMNDTYEIAKAVINDHQLPIDRNRIVMGGFSAGGNLSLSISQRAPLKDLIKGVVAFYPAVDMSTDIPLKLTTRPHTEKEDMLVRLGPLFDFGYVPQGYDRSDPLLSPQFAKREDLPKWLYIIGAEEDLLNNEARIFAEKMSGLKPNQPGTAIIKGVDAKDGWEHGTIRYESLRGVEHNFTHGPQQGAREVHRQQQMDKIYERVKDWLEAGPLKEERKQ
jgi:acetyl esterase/lipase